MIIKCVVACFNAGGEPDFYFCKVECADAEYDVGAHYETAEEFAYDEGYSGPMVSYDENDGPDWLFEHFEWDSADLAHIEDDEEEDEEDDAWEDEEDDEDEEEVNS